MRFKSESRGAVQEVALANAKYAGAMHWPGCQSLSDSGLSDSSDFGKNSWVVLSAVQVKSTGLIGMAAWAC